MGHGVREDHMDVGTAGGRRARPLHLKKECNTQRITVKLATRGHNRTYEVFFGGDCTMYRKRGVYTGEFVTGLSIAWLGVRDDEGCNRVDGSSWVVRRIHVLKFATKKC